MIRVNERFFIGGDERNYTVYQRANKIDTKTGKPRLDALAYYHNIGDCVEYIYKRETRKWVQEHDADLHTALVAFGKIKREIIAAVEGAQRAEA